MKPLRSLLSVLLLAAPSLAQFDVDWSRLYENESGGNEECRFTALAFAPDGRIFAAATSMPYSNPRFLRYGPNGQVLWSRLYGQSICTYSKVFVGAAGEALFVGEHAPTTVWHTLEAVSVSVTGNFNWRHSLPVVPSAAEPVQAAVDAAGTLSLASNAATAAHSRFAAISAGGTLLFDHLIDLVPNANESVIALELADDGDVFLAGNSGSSGFVARVDTTGQILWSHALGVGPGFAASVRGLRLANDGALVALGIETNPGQPPRLCWRRFDADGAALGVTELHGATGISNGIRGIERASDGSLWSVGASGSALFVARFDPQRAVARSFVWSTPLDIGDFGRPTLVPATAGQVWVTANVRHAPVHLLRHGVVLLLGPDLDGAGAASGIGLRLLFGDNVELKEIITAALSSTGRLVVAGRSDSFISGPLYFDPIGWIAQLNASAAPSNTCAGQTDASGCTPTLVVSGLPQSDATEGFFVRCVSVTPQRSGLFFYGTNGAANSPLGGGTLCVASPVRRGPLLDSGASALACGGTLELDWAAYASGALGGTPLAQLSQPGTVVHLQGWIREPSEPSGALLTDGLRYVVLP